MQLTDLLKNSPTFQAFPLEQREVFARLASDFEDAVDLAIYLSPSELTEKLGIGNTHLWQTFLQLEPVQQFMRGQTAFNAQVASRKAIQSLAKQAASGDVQAAKQVNEISGILNQDTHRTIILHQIARPKLIPKPQEQEQEQEQEVTP